MLFIHDLLLYLHIAVGVLAMALFWIPVATAKGGLNHRRFGLVYTWSMYTVAVSATVMSIMVLLAPNYFKAELIAASKNPDRLLQVIYGFWTLLLVLSLLTLNSVNQAMVALKTKKCRALARRPYHLLVSISLLLASLALLVTTIAGMGQPVLGYVFAIGGSINALQALHYAFAKKVNDNRWIVEHLSGMLGSGIAVYTAFFAFGARHLLAFIGQWQLLFWILPGILGGLAIHWWSRKYSRQTPLAS